MTTAMRARRPPVDVNAFAGDVREALAAFGTDAHYGVLIARAAVTITRKRTGLLTTPAPQPR